MAKILKKNNVFLIILFIYLFSYYVIHSSMLSMNPGMDSLFWKLKNIIILVSLICAVTFNKFSIKQILLIVFLLINLFLVRIIAGSSPLLDLLCFVLLLKDVDVRKLLKVILFSQIISYLTIFLGWVFDYIPERLSIRDGVVRSSLGFWHANTAGFLFLSMFLLTLVLCKKNQEFIVLVLYNVIGFFLLKEIDSRTTQYLLIFSTLIFFINHFVKVEKIRNKLVATTQLLIYFAFTIISYMLSFLYNTSNIFLVKLNSILTSRISLGKMFLNEYGISFWGQKVSYNSPNSLTQVTIGLIYRVLDNSFLKYLINYGLFSIVLLSILLFYTFSYLPKDLLIKSALASFILLAIAFNEQAGLSMEINFILFMSICFFQKSKNLRTGDIT